MTRRERDRVAQRNQLGGALGCLDRGNASDAQHIPLGRLAVENARQRIG